MEKQTKIHKRSSVSAVPEGMHSVTPYLMVNGAQDLIRFIEQSFNGKVTAILKSSDNKKVMHAIVTIGDSQLMIADATDQYPEVPCRLYLYVEDVDLVYRNALRANTTSLREPTDEFYGDRSCGVKDAWGNEWWIATHVEDVDNAEIEKRAKKFEQGVEA